MSAVVDRACVYGLLAEHGPMTAEEVRAALPNATAWDYGKVHYALRGLVRAGWVRAAGKGSGQYVLWWIA